MLVVRMQARGPQLDVIRKGFLVESGEGADVAADESGGALRCLPVFDIDGDRQGFQDQRLPLLRLGLYDWVIAWDRVTGRAWLGGRAVDGDLGRLDRRLSDVLGRLEGDAAARIADLDGPVTATVEAR